MWLGGTTKFNADYAGPPGPSVHGYVDDLLTYASYFLGPLIYLDDTNKFTVAIGLANFVTRANTPWNLLMAANLMAIIPLVLVYFFAQEKLIGGIASVGLKG